MDNLLFKLYNLELHTKIDINITHFRDFMYLANETVRKLYSFWFNQVFKIFFLNDLFTTNVSETLFSQKKEEEFTADRTLAPEKAVWMWPF